MLYRVLHDPLKKNEIAVLGVRPEVMLTPGALVAPGNAAAYETEILPREAGIKAVTAIWSNIDSEWWRSDDGSKRKIMAECLVPNEIPPDCVHTIFVPTHEARTAVQGLIPSSKVSIVPEPQMFFRPTRSHRVTRQLSLAEGDMFFSSMQTLTVSVNTVGIMGKGLASRAKYQFPDVYVEYQDACRSKRLRMGKPYLYKRERFLDEDLADEPSTLPGINAKKWFLLFATKQHWRDESDIDGIAQGLDWIKSNYKKEGITSLALPALGCGLGKLEWAHVGPLMCQTLSELDVNVVVYLPREKEIDKNLLSPKHLLNS
jgi:O-acetyl-ADP-ribose deacetylase (regulator of RNase III)